MCARSTRSVGHEKHESSIRCTGGARVARDGCGRRLFGLALRARAACGVSCSRRRAPRRARRVSGAASRRGGARGIDGPAVRATCRCRTRTPSDAARARTESNWRRRAVIFRRRPQPDRPSLAVGRLGRHASKRTSAGERAAERERPESSTPGEGFSGATRGLVVLTAAGVCFGVSWLVGTGCSAHRLPEGPPPEYERPHVLPWDAGPASQGPLDIQELLAPAESAAAPAGESPDAGSDAASPDAGLSDAASSDTSDAQDAGITDANSQ